LREELIVLWDGTASLILVARFLSGQTVVSLLEED